MLFVTIFNTIVILLAIIIHYECLRLLTIWMPKLTIAARLRILVGVIGALAAHIAEIWVFGFAYYLLVHLGHGHLVNQHGAVEFLDYVYFSMTSFSTLGIGDLTPRDQLRFLAGMEALTGMVLITWTASFLYVEMQRYWESK